MPPSRLSVSLYNRADLHFKNSTVISRSKNNILVTQNHFLNSAESSSQRKLLSLRCVDYHVSIMFTMFMRRVHLKEPLIWYSGLHKWIDSAPKVSFLFFFKINLSINSSHDFYLLNAKHFVCPTSSLQQMHHLKATVGGQRSLKGSVCC